MMKLSTLRSACISFAFKGSLLAIILGYAMAPAASAQVGNLVISQVYGGGGNSGAPFTHDFVELFNPTGATVSLAGWSIQYASAAGTTWNNNLNLSGSIAPGRYYLIQLSGGATGSPLPTPDLTGSINMSATAGKVALVNTTTALTGACPTGSTIVDFVGFGSTACFEGAGPTPAGSNTASVRRLNNGCKDTNNNNQDFAVANPPTPRNSSATPVYCYPVQLVITNISPASPTAGQGFSVTVEARNAAGQAQDVLENTIVTLSTNGNAGPLSGTTSGVIDSGTSSVVIDDVVFATEGTGVTITATRTAGQLFLAPFTSAPFTVQGGANTSVQFTTPSSTAADTDGTHQISVSISNPSATVATTVYVTLASGTSSRIGGFTSQMVTFPAGSAAPQVVDLTLVDEEECQPNELFTFILEDPAGGEGTVSVGTPSTHEFELLDGDRLTAVQLARQQFSGTGADNWTIIDGAANVSTADGAGDTPPNQRILSAPASWQVQNSTDTLDLDMIVPDEWTGMVLRARVASLSTTTGNGADIGDRIRFFVDLDGEGFQEDPDITIEGFSNARWGYTATGVAATTAGNPAYFQPSAGGSITDGFSLVEIEIPDGTTSFALRVIANNNATAEIWAVDNIEVVGDACPRTWYSQDSGTMDQPIWSLTPVGTPGTALINEGTNVVIQAGDFVVSNINRVVNDLRVETGAGLEIADNTALSVHGTTLQLDGAFTTGTGTLALVGDRAATLSAAAPVELHNLTVNRSAGTTVTGALGIRGTLQLTAGAFDATAATVTLVSTADGTGRLGEVNGGAYYVGDMTVQRYIPAGATNWRLLGSPVQGATIAQWMDDFFTAGFPGSHFPAFYDPPGSGILWPSIRWYDETVASAQVNDGVVGVASSTSELEPGLGYAAWSGDALGGTASFVIDVTGEPNIAQAPLELPLFWTDSGNPTVDGFNLVSNPVPSAINFTEIDRGADVANIYYVFDPASGNNLAWSNGFGIGSADGIIRSSQGFWMKATGPDATASVHESAKVNTLNGGTFGGLETITTPMIRLAISTDLNAYNDQSLIIFEGGSPAMDAEDVLKFAFSHPDAPQVATRSTEGHDLQIDFHGGYENGITIPVTVNVAVSGTYRLRATMLAMNSLSCVSLEDLVTGITTPMNGDAEYLFQIGADDDASTPRFILHASATLPFNTTDVLCSGQNNGSASVEVLSGPLDISWTNAVGEQIEEMLNADGVVTLAGLHAGSYMVAVSGTGTSCGTLYHEFSIDAPFELEGTVIEEIDASCDNTPDGRLVVMPQGGVEPFEFLWNDGTDVEVLDAVPGTYTLTITDANDCSWTSDALVIALHEDAPVAMFTVPDMIEVDQPVIFTNTSINGEVTSWTFGDGGASEEHTPTHVYTLPGTYTVTLGVEGGECLAVHSQEVVVTLGTSIHEVTTFRMNAWSTGDHINVEHDYSDGTVRIEVLDATGRVHIERSIAGSPGRITIPANKLSSGIWFVRISNGVRQDSFRVPLIR